MRRFVGTALGTALIASFIGLGNSLTLQSELIGLTCAAVVAVGFGIGLVYLFYVMCSST